MSETVSTGSEFVTVEIDGGVATIGLNRPKVNVLNVEMQLALKEAARIVTERSDVAAVVIYGGTRAFAAGVDIKEMEQMTTAQMSRHVAVMHSAYDAIAAIPKPVVAAVTGYALGGGCELALCADWRIAADDATFGQPEILLGIIPGAGGSQRLPRLIGISKAKDLIFTGRFITADEALNLGLADVLVPAAEVVESAMAWARQFVGQASVAIAAAKNAIDAGMATDLTSGLLLERVEFAKLFGTEDRAIGMASFVENGPGKAKFLGR
ncbi:MAG: enoyl-CoA hydratase/isomerase family protein [Propionibacteriaceae bacterium]